ncbi:MAG TPA: DNA polymerase III subunit delta [Clostridiales bacterium]|nr:DNA polymerase III subunit delta [Clostridiales bacterium]
MDKMRRQSEADLKKNIASPNAGGLYVLFGRDMFMVQKAAAMIADAFVPADYRVFNYHVFDGFSFSVDEVAEAASALPVFGEKTCVLINGLDIANLGKDETQRLIDFSVQTDSGCCLIIEIFIPKETRDDEALRHPVIKAAMEACRAYEIRTPDDSSLAGYVIKNVARRNKRIEPATARYLIDKAGTQVLSLKNEMDKVCAYSQGDTVTAQDIDAVVTPTAEEKAYLLVESIFSGNAARAIAILGDLFVDKQEKPETVMGRLIAGFAFLYRVKAAEQSGVSTKKLAEEYYGKKIPYSLEKLYRSAHKLALRQAGECLEILAMADTAIKSSTAEPQIIAQETVIKLLAAVNRPA